MKRIVINVASCAVFLSMVTAVTAQVKQIAGGKEAFEKELKGAKKPVIVKFFAPWCGFCKRIAPRYEALEKKYPECAFLEVDVTKEPELGHTYSPEGFPTFVAFKKGTVEVADQVIGADEEGLEACIKKHSGQKIEAPIEKPKEEEKKEATAAQPTTAIIGGVNTIKTPADLQAFQKSGNPLVVKVHATWCGACKMMTEPYEELATQTPEVIFLDIDVDQAQELGKQLEVSALPTFLFFEAGKTEPVQKVTGARKQEVIRLAKELQKKAQHSKAEAKPAAPAQPEAKPAAKQAEAQAGAKKAPAQEVQPVAQAGAQPQRGAARKNA